MFFKYSSEFSRSSLLSQNDLILEFFIFAFFVNVLASAWTDEIDSIVSIEVTFCVVDVLLSMTDEFSKLLSVFLSFDDFDVFTINEKNDSILLVSILLFLLVIFDSKVNCEINVFDFFCEKDDFRSFIILEFSDFSVSENCFVSILLLLISNWDLSFLSFFFDLMLNLSNSFQISFSFNKVLEIYFSFSVICSLLTH
jgi:signal transduction histidine kinase